MVKGQGVLLYSINGASDKVQPGAPESWAED